MDPLIFFGGITAVIGTILAIYVSQSIKRSQKKR